MALLVITLLASLGAGGVFAAQHLAGATTHPAEAQVTFNPQVVTLVKAAPGQQAHPPVA